MKILNLTRKMLIEAWREPQLLLVFILFPPAMLLIFYFAYGQSSQSMARMLNITVINQDKGMMGTQFVDRLRNEKLDGSPVFTVEMVPNRETADPLLNERKAVMLLIIPADFTEALNSGNTNITVISDPLFDNAVFAGSFLSNIIDSYSNQKTGWQKTMPVIYEYVPGTGTINDFQFAVPGMLVFGVLFGIITSAMLLTRETVNGTLQRMRLAGVKARDLMGGIVLVDLLAALGQMLVSYGVAATFGFRSPGSLLLAAGIIGVLSLTSTSFGLLTACFARSDGEAASLGTGFMAPLVFLSGAVFPLPVVPLGVVAGRTINLYDILPSTHASEAMRRVLILGDGINALTYELGMLLVLTILSLVLGIGLFQRMRLKNG